MTRQSSSSRAFVRSFERHPIALAAAAVMMGASGPLAAQVLPVAPAVVSGSASVSTSGNQMLVTNSPNAIINWQAFSIGAQNAVRFQQQGASSQVLNRVVGNDLSSILGTLSSNGRVWLVNPNGVVFGQGARIDVGGLVASTLNISNEDFLSGKYAFQSTGGKAAVVNKGDISTSLGGRVWLVGESVANEGAIKAEGGSIVLAAGKSVELVDSAAPNVRVKLTAPENEALNLGSLLAQGGSVDVHGGMVNQSGIVRADSLGMDPSGRITLSAKHDLKLGPGSTTSASSASGASNAGSVTLDAAEGLTDVSGKVLATGGSGAGGLVVIQGEKVKLSAGAEIDASGASAGGRVLVGGDYQGQNPAVHNARQTLITPDAKVAADATVQGDGGRVIVWGTDTAQVYGAVSARGAGALGNGGFIETSGGSLDVRASKLDVQAGPGGKGGAWLIDPNNITITNSDGDQNFPRSGEVFTTAGDDTRIYAGDIERQLEQGTNVTVRTGTAGNNTQAGDITFAASVVPVRASAGPALGSLSFEAHRDILLVGGRTIGATGGAMPISLTADFENHGDGRVAIQDSSILSSGGAIRLEGGGRNSVTMGNSVLDAGSGSVTLITRDTPSGTGVLPGFVFDNSSITAGSVRITGGSMIANSFGGTSTITSPGAVDIDMNVSISAKQLNIEAGATTLTTGALALRNSSITASSLAATANDIYLEDSSIVSDTSVSLRSTGNIALLTSSIDYGSGPVNITLAADTNSDGNGTLYLYRSTLFSGGGNMTLSGSAQSLGSGVGIDLSTVHADGGVVTLTGRDHVDGAVTTPGIRIDGGSLNAEELRLRGDSARFVDADVRLGEQGLDAALHSFTVSSTGERTVRLIDDAFSYEADSLVFSSGPVKVAADQIQVNEGTALISRTSMALSGITLTNAGRIEAQGNVDLNITTAVNTSAGSEITSASTLTLAGGSNALGPNLTLADSSLNMSEGNLRVNNLFASGDSSITASNDAPLIIAANNIQNNSGPSLLSNPLFGWRLYLPAPQALGGLAYDAEQFSAPAYTPPLPGAGSGNLVLYAAPMNVAARLPGKTYDGNTQLNYDRFESVQLSCGTVPCTGYRLVSQPFDGPTTSVAFFRDKNAGVNKQVDSVDRFFVEGARGNAVYGAQLSYTSDILARQLTATAQAADKMYDGTAVAQGTVNVVGLVANDQVSSSASGTFGSRAGERPKDVATGKPVTFTVSLTGDDAGNYIAPAGPLTSTASITPRPLAASVTAADKPYDGNTNATVNVGTLTNLVAGDEVTLAGATGTFGSKSGERPQDVASGKPVTVVFNFSGADALNYTAPTGPTASTTASITPRTLTLAGVNAADKTYDGGTAAVVSATGLSNVVPDDVVTVGTLTGVFGSKAGEPARNVATDKPVAVTGALAGANANNYVLSLIHI